VLIAASTFGGGKNALTRVGEHRKRREDQSSSNEASGDTEAVRKGFERGALAAGFFTSVIALLALSGWPGVGGPPGSGSWLPTMVPSAAVSLLMLGAALALLAARRGRVAGWVARSLALLAAVVGLLNLIQYFPVGAIGVELRSSGRIEPAAALAVLLLGLSLAGYDLRSRRVHHVAEIMVLVAAVIAIETLFGRAFGMNVAYGLGRFPAMPVDKALALFTLAMGIVLLRPNRGWFGALAAPGASGVTLRRLIPVALAAPFLIGWLAHLGVAAGWFSVATGLTLLVSSMCLLLLGAVAWTTRELHRIDQERLFLLRSEREARAHAEQESADKSDFLGFMSHDFRTPLNGVISYAELLEVGFKGPLNEDQLRYVRRIRSAGSHLCSMIDELLEFTRARRGVIKPELRCVDAIELAREALAVVQHESKSSRVELCDQLPTGLVEVHTDPDKVLHVLVNFLGNALKFTQEGRVGIRLLQDERGVVYEVWDTGPGIPREHRDHIFQEFIRLERTTKGRKGTGLGLAICARFAEMVGGKVELDSWVGRGSVFRLVLPQGDGQAAPHAHHAEGAGPPSDPSPLTSAPVSPV
jgi:signal transduction histidine kinase